MQDALFGTATTPLVPVEVARDEMRLCALNVQSAGTSRVQPLLDWIFAEQHNALVLTEMRAGASTDLLLRGLREEGFTVVVPEPGPAERYVTALAGRGFTMTPVQPGPPSSRVVAADLTAGDSTVRLVGVYGMTNGMTAESSQERAGFQRLLLDYLASISTDRTCVAGDLNIVEPGHQPPLPAFERHDLDCYDGIVGLGLRDAYRQVRPDGREYSWISDRYGAQRLDHTFVGQRVGVLAECRYDHSTRAARLSDHAAMCSRIIFE